MSADFFQGADERLRVACELHRSGIGQELALATHASLDQIAKKIADETGQPIEKVRKDTDRNFWLSPEEAKAYGFVTHIVASVADMDKV